MTAPAGQATVRCPICVDSFTWSLDTLYQWDGDGYTEMDLSVVTDEGKRRDMIGSASVLCPNPSGDMTPHFLPTRVVASGAPLVIGLIGATRAGKSHLLAAMINEINLGRLLDHGLQADPVDMNQHLAYLEDYVVPFVGAGEQLAGTTEGRSSSYAYATLVRSPRQTRAVTFFDIAGGDLLRTGRTGRFLAGVGGLIFVVDPRTAVGAGADDDPVPAAGRNAGDETFRAVLARLRETGSPMLDVPAAIVVTKADRLRFRPPVDAWMRRDRGGRLSATALAAESRDVYAFLHSRSAHSWLAPFHSCRRCTLHFASATGGEAAQGSFPQGVRPARVLEPLLALFAMAGLLERPDAAEVGRA